MFSLLTRRRTWGIGQMPDLGYLIQCPGLLRDDPPAGDDDGNGGDDKDKDKDKDDKTDKTDKEIIETRIADAVSKAIDTSGANTAKLLANPHVRAIIEAQERGEKVKVITGKDIDKDKTFELMDLEIPKGDEGDDKSPVEDMTNAQLVGFITKGLGNTLGKKLDDRLSSLERSIGYLHERDEDREDQNISDSLASVRKKYPDFDTYRAEIIAIGKKNPNLPLEEMYLLARVRKGDGYPTPRATASEKPTTETGSRRKRDGTDKPIKLQHGRRGFAAMLAEAQDRVEEEE